MNPRALTTTALLLGLASTACIIHVDANGFDWEDSYDYQGTRIRGNGVRASEGRQVESFDSVQVSGRMDVRVTVGGEQQVSVLGDENLLREVETYVEDGVLVLRMDHDRYKSKNDLIVEIDVPDLASLSLNGSGDAWVDGIDRPHFALALNGSGDIEVNGRADTLDVALHGSGDLDLDRLQVGQATVSIVGSGDVRLAVSDTLDGAISGSGDITYYGQPQTNASISGSGYVKRMRE
ncbi:MAG: DUF2807 domain-containing protein [bacterium]|nr:DUF2807 domain-containing protein [bacterium]